MAAASIAPAGVRGPSSSPSSKRQAHASSSPSWLGLAVLAQLVLGVGMYAAYSHRSTAVSAIYAASNLLQLREDASPWSRSYGERLEAVALPPLAYRGDEAARQAMPLIPAGGRNFDASLWLARDKEAPDCVSFDPDPAAPLEARVEAVVAALPAKQNGPVTWTVANEAYTEMFDESWAMMERVGLAGRYFVACLDRGCARHHCARGRAHILLLHENEQLQGTATLTSTATHQVLVSKVALSKFEIAAALARLGHDFLFLELDVWLRRNPMPLFAAPEDEGTDLFIGAHLDNPWLLNIGIYFVVASTRTAGLFDGLAQLMADNPHVHDQVLMNCVLRNNATLFPPRPQVRDLCKVPLPGGDPVDYATGPAARQAIAAAYRVRTLDPLEVINAAAFEVLPHTVAVHVLAARPLASRVGKINVAKEWLLYEGANGYYDVSPESSRFLLHDGPLHATLFAQHYRNSETLLDYLLHLVALARATGRTLILPRILHFERHLPAWALLDTATLEERAGVPWRALRFLEKATFPSVSSPAQDVGIAQVHVQCGGGGVVGVRTGLTLARAEAWRRRTESTGKAALPLGEERWYRLDVESDPTRRLTQAIDFLNSDEALSRAPLLRVSLDAASLPRGDERTHLAEVKALRALVDTCAIDDAGKRRRDIDPANRDCHERLNYERDRQAKAREAAEGREQEQQENKEEQAEG